MALRHVFILILLSVSGLVLGLHVGSAVDAHVEWVVHTSAPHRELGKIFIVDNDKFDPCDIDGETPYMVVDVGAQYLPAERVVESYNNWMATIKPPWLSYE